MELKRGEWKIIRVDGTEATVQSKPTLQAVYEAIGCENIDTVTLDHKNQVVMMVDDVGMIDGKPVNKKATALMKEAFGRGYPNAIHGDVAIVNDEDFA